MADAEEWRILEGMTEEQRATYLADMYPPHHDEKRVLNMVLRIIRNSADRFPRAVIITSEDGNCGGWHVRNEDHAERLYDGPYK